MQTDITKAEGLSVAHEEQNLKTENLDDDAEYSYEEQRKIVHKVDRRLVTVCGLMYCVSLMDRTNLSNAAIAGMTHDLKLSIGTRYSTIALVFFITYALFQPATSFAIRRIGARWFLGTLCVCWGIMMIGFGFVNVWTTMVALRIVLGIFEAGFFPGCAYLISTWYSRYDYHKRIAFFYVIGSVASAASGILAFGFMQMKGLAGLNGWRWIFIMEGILSVLIGIFSLVMLVNFPDRAKDNSFHFLTEKERFFILRRVDRDRGDAILEPFSWRHFFSGARDWKLWAFGLIFFCQNCVGYSIAYFLPIILREKMKFSVGASQCLVAPPYALGGVLMMIAAWTGDKYHIRGPVLAGSVLITFIGLPLMAFVHHNSAVQYFGVFLVTGGTWSGIPTLLAYQANNIRGQWKRSFASALLMLFASTGGVAGSLVFRSQDAPNYLPGIYTAFVANGLIVVMLVILTTHFLIANKKQSRGERINEGLEGFRYTI